MQAIGNGICLLATRHIEFAIDAMQLCFDSIDGDYQFMRNLRPGIACKEQA